MSNDDDRSSRGGRDQPLHTVGDDAKRVDGMADPRFLRRYVTIEKVARYAPLEFRLRPAAVTIVPRDRDEQYRDSLREILSETSAIQRIDEELVPVRRTAVDDGERRHPGDRISRRELQPGDVPVETVDTVPNHVPFRGVPEPFEGQLFERARIECSAGCRVGERLHTLTAVWQRPTEP